MASKSIGMLNIVFGADLRGFDRAMKKAQKNIKKFGNNLKKTGKNLTQNLTLPLVAVGVAGVRAFDKQEKAIAQVEAGLKSTGNQVGITSEELQKMAADLQKTTLFGDEEILQGATAQLLTFTNIAGEQFVRTQEVALDLATRLDGDLKSASIMLGKALNDPVANLSALSRAGIQFSTEQKDLVKSLVETNRLADAQTIILNELEKQYGGSAEAAAKAGLGPIQQLGNVLSDISEDIGAILLPMIQELALWVTNIAEKFRGLDEPTKKIVVTMGLLAAALGPVMVILGSLTLTITALSGPIGVIVVAIGALVTALTWLVTSSSDTAINIRNAFTAMANTVIKSINSIISAINLINPFKQIKPIKEFSYETKTELEEVADTAENTASALTGIGNSIDDVVGKMPELTEKTQKYTDALEVIQTDWLLNMSPIEEQFKNILIWTGDLRTEAEKNADALKATFESLMEDLGQNLSKGADDFKEFGNMVKNGVRGVIKALIAEGIATAIATALKSSLKTGQFWTIPVFTGAAVGLANTAFESLVPKFADGGLVRGATFAQVGEGSGTSAFNPEVIAPLDKLMSMMGGDRVTVSGRIQGDDIVLISDKATISRERFI